MPQSEWTHVAAARGLHLSDAELAKLSAAMDALDPAYQSLVAGLTYEVEPLTTVAEEAVEAR